MIVRSAGLPTGIAGFLCGNGYSGITDKLDDAVATAANCLQEIFPHFDIQIRFNSDRISGGAWLISNPGPDAIGKNADVGLNAHLWNIPRLWKLYKEINCGDLFADWCRERGIVQNGDIEQISYYVNLSRRFALDASICTEGGSRPYAYINFAKLGAAAEFIRNNVRLRESYLIGGSK